MRRHKRDGQLARYRDAEDPDFIAALPPKNVAVVVSTLRDRVMDRSLLQGPKQLGFRGKVAVPASTRTEAEELRRDGVELVLVPYSDAANEAPTNLSGNAVSALRPVFEESTDETVQQHPVPCRRPIP
jgi:hypothetical protein